MKTLRLLLCLVFLLSVNLSLSQEIEEEYPLSDQDIIDNASLDDLMISCYVCHNPRIKSHDNMIAPPLISVKYIYKLRYPSKKEFTNKMTAFVLNPDNQKAIMQGPVMKFGVMPEMPMDETQVRRIAQYIYSHEIEEPIWFSDYFEQKHGISWPGQ
ncbi:MAG: hypothetical protein JXR10_10965 [Cyclobacteriaceae bacterium]